MINRFSGKYDFLSNFYPVAVKLDGELYSSVEHAYQAVKTVDLPARLIFQSKITPGTAKALGRKITNIRPDWEQVKVDVMRDLLRQKFQQEDLRTRLIATGDEELVEGNTWGDTFWGVCRGKGQNLLGLLLMEIRMELMWEF